MDNVFISVDEAKKFAEVACRTHDISAEESKIFADVLVEADMRGVMTHGLVRLPEYLERIAQGGMEAKLNLEILTNWPWGGSLDAGNGIGHVAAYEGMRWVINKAREQGIGMATMRMSNHFGVAAYFSLMAVKENMIGVVASNSAPLMAPWGGREVKIGNNPLAISVPGKDFPLSFDMASSVAARSKLYKAQREGKEIPKHWALNNRGEETTNPTEALEGALLPLGGHKGYGLALMVDIFTGVLSGGTVSANITSKYDYSTPRNIGHFFLAINIEHFLPLESFLENLDNYVGILQNTEFAQGFDKVKVPGEGGDFKRKESLKKGISYHSSSIKVLNEMAVRLGISPLKDKRGK